MPARIPTQVASKRGACRRTEQGDGADRVRNGAGVPGAGHLFEEPGALSVVARLAAIGFWRSWGRGLCLLVFPEALTLADGLLIAAADSDS